MPPHRDNRTFDLTAETIGQAPSVPGAAPMRKSGAAMSDLASGARPARTTGWSTRSTSAIASTRRPSVSVAGTSSMATSPPLVATSSPGHDR